MLDVGWSEILVIAVVAILVVGPKDLPVLLRTVGRYVGQMRRMAGEFRAQFDQAMREAELSDVQDVVRDVKKLNPVGAAQAALSEGMKQVKDIPQAVQQAKPAAEAAPIAAPAAPAAGNGTTATVATAPVASPTAAAAPEPAETADEEGRRSVAQRAADAWKKAAGDSSGA